MQGAVDAAIAKFAKHPHPSSHLEKPQRSWDDRIRTLEVDNRWRGIVLAPMTGDTYCLVTILPKDKAKAYATSHRFSVNPALGVLEVRDEEAIQRLRLLLQEASKPNGKRLFADVSDADLGRLGVDAQILPMIRLMTSEADLETRQTALPEAQYAALHALACGMTLDEAREEVARLYSAGTPPEQVDPDDLVTAMERSPSQVTFVSGHEELRLILAHPFAAWRMFLHPSQRKIAYRTSYSGPAQVTGGPGTGKTVTLLHRAAFLAARTAKRPAGESGATGRPQPAEPGTPQVLVTTFNGTLADALGAQLDLLIKDDRARGRIEVLNVDRLAYRIVKAARGAPVIADERVLRTQWAAAAAAAGLDFTPAFLKNEWEQVILAQDLQTEQSYLTCLRTGRGRPLTKLQRSQVWQAALQVAAELATARQSTHLQLANEATHLLRETGAPSYLHILVDEAQDLHPSQWRLLRAAVAPGNDDLFIVADPHQRIYDNRVSLASMRISVRGRSQRLSLSYRTTQEVLTWAVSLLGTEPVTGLDGEVDSLLGYRSPMHGPRPQLRMTATRSEEFGLLAEQIRSWLALGIEPQAIGVTARSASLVREARQMLKADDIMTVPLSGRRSAQAARAGTMHAMKGLEFQAVAVIGVERGLVPEPATITPESEDPAAYVQDLQRERCVLFVACTRARDHLYVSGTGQPSTFLPAPEADQAPAERDGAARASVPASPPKVSMRELLWSREDSWRPRLRCASLIAEADLRPDHTRQVAVVLGRLYADLRHPRTEGDPLLSRWPACLAAAMAGVAARDNEGETYWRALWAAACFQGTPEDEVVWGHAFKTAIGRLGMAVFPELPIPSAGAILMHAGVPAYCLGDYFRLLASRRRLDPGLDAEGFLAWATATGHETRLSQLAEPARRFLLNGGGYAHDIVDRTLDLLDRLTEPEPDLDGAGLPGYLIEAAKAELAAGHLDLSGLGRRRAGGRSAMLIERQVKPRIALDPYGQGVHVLLPAVDDARARTGTAAWRITADGDAHPGPGRPVLGHAVQAGPLGADTGGPLQAAFPLKPVRTVLVSLAGHEGPATELRVVDPADPVLFFSADGRRLAGTASLPGEKVWIIHPTDRELEFTGRATQIAGPTGAIGWDGWLQRLVSLENVQAVGLPGCRSHPVEVRARPRLLLDDPLPGVATPAGAPVYAVPPRLLLPQNLGASIRWQAEVRRAGGGASLGRRVAGPAGELDIWEGIPRPALGAFEITVRGPLGRGLRRTIFVAEGLSVTYQPRVRPLTGAGLTAGVARLTAAAGATAQPTALRFGPREHAHLVEYQTDAESVPLVVTPPHVAVLCTGAGNRTWTTAQIHLVAEDFATAGRLLVLVPPGQVAANGNQNRPQLAVLVRGQQVQVIEASGQQSPEPVVFELAHAADTIAAYGRAELAVDMGGALMPVGHVRPRRMAMGVDSIFNGPCCSLHY
ncbi:MAG: UvrD-helicase domain-containing protein [Trebonia sp.]